jgi:hypothetical protein
MNSRDIYQFLSMQLTYLMTASGNTKSETFHHHVHHLNHTYISSACQRITYRIKLNIYTHT